MTHTDISLTYLEYVEPLHPASEDTVDSDGQEAKERIHMLSALAGLNAHQGETIVALFVYGGNTTLPSHMRRCTSRNIRNHRQLALEKIKSLG